MLISMKGIRIPLRKRNQRGKRKGLGQLFDKINTYLIANGAARTILQGLWTTVRISMFAIVLGTLLGALLCLIRMKGPRLIRGLVRVYTGVLRGTPVSLLLLMMYYVVFAKTPFSAEIIAVITYALNMSAHTAELMYAAFSSVNRGQVEAARTLGFSALGAFGRVTLPQAWNMARSVYQSTVINIIQWTSVVGFITITDLTRVINNFSARTLQPVFMICFGMLLYLVVSYLVYALFGIRRRKKHASD